ncbi:MAG: stage II sporulation protein M [Bacilli bacterium]
MVKLFKKIIKELNKEKKVYTFLSLILLSGLFFGSLFITILNEEDKLEVIKQITSFFHSIKEGKINYLEALKSSLIGNLLYISSIWLLGISIIGIPIIIFLVFLKGFIIGFSIITIIIHYKTIGILGAFTYIFPHLIINSLVILGVGCYAFYLSLDLFLAVIKRKNINFKNIINRYFFVLLLGIFLLFLSSLMEVYFSPFFIKFFLFFVK